MIVIRNGKSHIVTKKELDRRRNMSPEERRVRFRIAYEKHQYETYEVIMKHRMEIGVITTDKFIRTMNQLREKRDRNIKEIEKFYKPVIEFSSGHYFCYNSNFRKEYDIIVYGTGDTPKEAYDDWREEMIHYGYFEELEDK